MPVTELLKRNAAEHGNEVALVELNPGMEDTRKLSFKEYDLVQQTKAMEEMANTGETYHIPIMVNDEAGNMTLKIVRGNGESGLIKMALYLESTSTVSTTFRYEAGEVEANVECETAEMRDRFEQKAQEISEVMEKQTGLSFKFSFTRVSGLSLEDIYNWQLGKFEPVKSRDNEIQTEELYSIARSYINVIAEMF